MRKLRKNNRPRSPVRESYSSLDTWLTRLSHLSQLGLLAVAVVVYFYTVVPIYEKAKLEAEITKKQAELAFTKVELEASYIQLRKDIVGDYIFFTGSNCTGLLRAPNLPLKPGDRIPNVGERESEIFNFNVTNCLMHPLEESKRFKNLRTLDFNFLSERLKTISEKLENKKAARKKEFMGYQTEVRNNPNLLPPIDEDSYSWGTLTLLKKIVPPAEYQQQVYKIRVESGLSRISHAYVNDIQSELIGLRAMEWPKDF